ncbi:hypothetical protein [Caballeronia sp. 15711]|uniref:hypothetical protein n=1 Tax=Caballeronia sp. 15711 TaxID=3391029 RepID=UPI0039E3D4CD
MPDKADSIKAAYDALSVLLEAAIRDQESISQAAISIERLADQLQKDRQQLPSAIVDAVVARLDDTVRATADGLTERIRVANLEAVVAAAAMKRAARYASARLVIATTLVALLTCGAVVGVMRYVVHYLIAERDKLTQNIAVLESQGARLDLISCIDEKNRQRVCVRVNKVAQLSQKGYEDYRLAIPKK